MEEIKANYFIVRTYDLLKVMEQHKHFNDNVKFLILSFETDKLEIMSQLGHNYAHSSVFFKWNADRPPITCGYFYIDFKQLIAGLKSAVSDQYIFLRPEEINGAWYLKIYSNLLIPVYQANYEDFKELKNIKTELVTTFINTPKKNKVFVDYLQINEYARQFEDIPTLGVAWVNLQSPAVSVQLDVFKLLKKEGESGALIFFGDKYNYVSSNKNYTTFYFNKD